MPPCRSLWVQKLREMVDFNILFTSAGRRVSLIKAFRESSERLGVRSRIITSDLKKNAPAAFAGDQHELVPRVTSPEYIGMLAEICKRHNVKLVIPLIDTELLLLSKNKEQFQRIGTTILVSSPEVNEICCDKRKTFSFFSSIGIRTPQIFDPHSIFNNPSAHYPFLLKPADGSSSIGVTKIMNSRELRFFIDYIPDAILQEYITGDEYTLDVLVDMQGKALSLVPRLRIETRAGEVSKGMTVKNKRLIDVGRQVVESLPGPTGCLTLQCFLSEKGEIHFIEINPRFGGGYPLSYAAGADFPGMIIQMMINRPFETAIDAWQDGLVMMRYDESICVPKEMIQ